MITSEELKKIGQEVAKVIEDNVNPQLETLRTDIQEIRGDIKEMRSKMVTKDYLDEKLADLRGDMVVLMRKEDTKLKSLIDLLMSKQVISADEAKRLFVMEPFAQML